MKDTLAADLERVAGLAFERVAGRREWVERFHGLRRSLKSDVQSLKSPGQSEGVESRSQRGSLEARVQGRKSRVHPPASEAQRRTGSPESRAQSPDRHRDEECLEKLYGWAFVPLSLWPVDVRGFGLDALEWVAAGRELDGEARLEARLLSAAPPERACAMISEYEQRVKAGSYEMLIAAQHKFDWLEGELGKNLELRADWEEIKGLFEVKRHQNASGVIRRRLAQERNFRPVDWKYSRATEEQRFQNVFDVFCHKWDLYGMEGDKPLLLKLTVNITPHGTIIMIPRYWSLDPKRDLKWGAITRLHRMRGVQRQGPKLSAGRVERRQESERARELWGEATEAGLKGQRRIDWVMGRMGWDARTDESRLRRILKGKS